VADSPAEKPAAEKPAALGTVKVTVPKGVGPVTVTRGGQQYRAEAGAPIEVPARLGKYFANAGCTVTG
jgi:hypothetical protein